MSIEKYSFFLYTDLIYKRKNYMSDRYNTNSRVANFSDFCNNWQSEKEKLKSAQKSFTPNSDRQQFVRNSRTEYNPVTHKLTDYTEDEIKDILNKMEQTEEEND